MKYVYIVTWMLLRMNSTFYLFFLNIDIYDF